MFQRHIDVFISEVALVDGGVKGRELDAGNVADAKLHLGGFSRTGRGDDRRCGWSTGGNQQDENKKHAEK